MVIIKGNLSPMCEMFAPVSELELLALIAEPPIF